MSAAEHTLTQYRAVLQQCRTLFLQKTADYGTSWRVLRMISLVDQIFIKAWRIRNIQETGSQKIGDSIGSEFVGIVNYGIIALIQTGLPVEEEWELPVEKAGALYDEHAAAVEALMLQKNSDYGEAWRDMCGESFVDLILVKLLRIRQIIANKGVTQVSEGADANFADIINYAVFALILSQEAASTPGSNSVQHPV